MKKLKLLLEKPWFAYTFATCAAVVLFMLLYCIRDVAHGIGSLLHFLSPIIIGVITAYLLNPVSSFFERTVLKRIKRDSARHTFGVVLTLICFVLIFVLLLVALIPSLIQSVSKLVNNWSDYTQKLDTLLARISALGARFGIQYDMANLSTLVDNAMTKIFEFVGTNINMIKEKISSIGSSISNFAIGIVFGFCFLTAKKTLVGLVMKVRYALITKKRAEQNDVLWKSCNDVFLRYIGCTLLDALIVGITTLLFMLVMRLPYAPLIAVVVALTNIIPTVGPMIGGAIGIFFLILDKPLGALWFLLFICALQALDGLVIKTRLFKGSLGIPGVWTLVLIILGGKIAGMMGILLAIPTAAIMVILYNETIKPKLEERAVRINAKEETNEETE